MSSSRLDVLKRTSAGRALRAEWEARLTAVVGMPRDSWRFLDIAATDQLRERCEAAFPARRSPDEAVPGRDFAELQIELGLAAKVDKPLVPSSAHGVFVLFLDSDKIGALSLPARTLNQYWKPVLRVERDGFVIVDDALLGKLVVQVIARTAGRFEMLDMAAWGETWVSTINQFVDAAASS